MAEVPIWVGGRAKSADAEEKSWIEALKTGSEEAFDWLIAEYASSVFRLAYRMLNDRADAADAVQDVFLKVFRSIRHFHGESSLRTWIYRITVNTAANQNRWWRRHKEQEFSLDSEEVNSAQRLRVANNAPDPFQSLLSQETQQMVQTAMKRLPESSRSVLVLREMESLRYEEIAAILHVSLGTVKSRLARARQALKHELESMTESPPARLPVWNTAEEG